MSLKRLSEILESMRGLACPHCGAGRDPDTVGLVWESIGQNWRCPICGCRIYEGGREAGPGIDEPKEFCVPSCQPIDQQ